MTDPSTDPLESIVGRVTAPDRLEWRAPDDVTGALADLLTWWRELAGTSGVRAVEVVVGATTADEAVTAGIDAVDRAVDAGASVLVPRVARRDDHAARAVIGLLARREASAVVGQPVGMTDRAWMVACADVRDRMAAAADLRGEPLRMLAQLGAHDIAAGAAALLAAAARRTPCLVDGTDELAAAVVADRLAHRATGWWRAATDSPDPARATAIDRIDLNPGLLFGLTDDAGRGAESTLALLTMLAGTPDSVR